MRRVYAGLAAALLTACGEKRDLVVESDTVWQGTIDDYGTVEGRGNAQFDIGGPDEVCWTFVKQSEYGTLRVYADDGTWLGLGSQVDGEQVTTAPSGQVRGCSQ